MEEKVDVVVVGAGVAGIAGARTYLQLEPSANLVILEAKSSLGGVWAKENLYPGLRTNNCFGTYEFTDLPMVGFGLVPEEHIPGEVLHNYLALACEKFDLTRRMRFDTNLDFAEKLADGWRLKSSHSKNGEQKPIECKKLIIATGLTARPIPISFPGEDSFSGALMNFSTFRAEAERIMKDMSIKTVTVVGGSKSSHDCVYLLASSGKKINWVLRKDGHGAGWLSKSHVYIGPMRMWLEELVGTRFLTWFSPCIWGDADGYSSTIRRFLHGTSVGRFLVRALWGKIGGDVIQVNGFRENENMKKLEPDASIFWSANDLGILNYPTDIYEYVRSGQITVHRNDPDHISKGKFHFKDGTSVPTDAVISSTGWRFDLPFKFGPTNIEASLGIPTTYLDRTESEARKQLDDRADVEVFTRFPELLKSPAHRLRGGLSSDPYAQGKPAKKAEIYTPWRLFRAMAPPGLLLSGDRSLIFLGFNMTTTKTLNSELQALWAYAYLNHKLAIDTKNVAWQTALATRWNKWRYPYGHGDRYPDFVFDALPYYDLLMRDLGLKWNRKGSLWRELFHGYFHTDYKGIVQEWMAGQKKLVE
ncbi:MAG: hypothetical protein M1829_004676 [Trizodia sp. TS-e1964]|nr:MAG: hypothetical protein M1829_004676 [Trizodia sp. TS-e1964]